MTVTHRRNHNPRYSAGSAPVAEAPGRPPAVAGLNGEVGTSGAAGGPGAAQLADVLSGPLGAFAIKKLRKVPRQDRAVGSVGRLLAAAAALSFERAGTDGLSVETIASRAGMTPQAAYRYFKAADELIRIGLRCVAVREHERLVATLSEAHLSSERDFAAAVVAAVLDARDGFDACSPHLHDDLLDEYRRVGDDASRRMAELICAGGGGSDARRSFDVVKLSVALTATFAIATSPLSKTASPLRGSTVEGMLTDLFVGVLQSAGSSFDALREMGPDYRAMFGDGAG